MVRAETSFWCHYTSSGLIWNHELAQSNTKMRTKEILFPDISYKIIGAAMEVHGSLGNGFLEKVYENALMIMFKEIPLRATQQTPIKVVFRNEIIGNYVADILIEDKIILELKIVDKITNIHRAQVLNYLKATGLKLAIIINFKNQSLEYERLVL